MREEGHSDSVDKGRREANNPLTHLRSVGIGPNNGPETTSFNQFQQQMHSSLCTLYISAFHHGNLHTAHG